MGIAIIDSTFASIGATLYHFLESRSTSKPGPLFWYRMPHVGMHTGPTLRAADASAKASACLFSSIRNAALSSK